MAGLRPKLGKYVIKSELGRGAMGVVYLAEDPRLHRPVALKTMSPSVAGDPELLKRFYREAESAAQLRHPNIVTIYEIDEAENIPFIAMEFLEGESLEKVIRGRRETPTFRKLDYIIQACRGLHHAHGHGIVHRDVKPGNIIVLTEGIVKIVDFGIARVTDASMTRTGTVLGTPMYMSPEQIRGKPVDARSDIFSIGVILYELLTYSNPFYGQDVPTIIFKILNENFPPLSSVLQLCPPALDGVVARALAKDRDQRYQTAEDLAFELQQQAEYLKKHMVDVFVEEGQRHLQAGNLTLARDSLQKVLEVDSRHDMARSLLFKVQGEIETRQQAQKIEQSLRQGQQALEAGLFDEAIELFDAALRLEPANAEAQQQRSLAIQRRDRSREITRSLERAEDLAARGDLAGTRDAAERLLALEPGNARGQQLIAWVRKEQAEQKRQAEVRQYLEAAQAHVAERNFAVALEFLRRARELDPVNLEVESLTRTARDSQKREQRRKVLQDRLTELEELLARENFEQAIGLADRALEEFPDNSQVVKLRAQAVRLGETQKKRRYVDAQLQAARECLQKNDYASAVGNLERALESAPNDTRLVAYLKTVREAQEMARQESARQEVIRQANDLIRGKDFGGAIRVLEGVQAQGGQAPEVADLLQFAREQQAEQAQQERVRQVLGRAQAELREENYAEAAGLLEQAQKATPAGEIAELLRAAREQEREYEARRKKVLQQAQELLRGGEVGKAVGVLDAAPRGFFKQPEFQQVYKQCREAQDRWVAVRRVREQVEKSLGREDWTGAEKQVEEALRSYGGDKQLLELQKEVREAEAGARRARLGKVLEDAKLAFGQMKYREVEAMLAGVDWAESGFADLAKQAASLRAEAHQREQEIAQRQTVVQHEPIPRPRSPGPPSRLEAQERLKETLPAGAARGPKGKPEPEPAGATLALSPPMAAAAPPPSAAPAPPEVLATKVIPVVTPVPARPPLPAAVVHAPARKLRMVLWAGIAVLAVATTVVAIWLNSHRGGPTVLTPGYVQVTASPWADVVSVRTEAGKSVDIGGVKQTPVQLELPPGEYVLELKYGGAVEPENVSVKTGESQRVHHTFSQVNVDASVDELVSTH